MTAKVQLLEDIIEEIYNIQGLTPKEIIGNDSFRLPRLIPAKDGRTIHINQKIDRTLVEFAKLLKRDKPETAKKIREREWISLVRSNIGPYLEKVDLSADWKKQAIEILNKINTQLDAKISGFMPTEYSFGSTFLDIESFEPFDVGAVKIERRDDWLCRISQAGHIDQVTKRRVERAWLGEKLHPRKNARDNISERRLLNAISNYPFVASVKVVGHAYQAGKEQALAASKLVMAAVSLFWQRPSEVLTRSYLSHDRGAWVESTLSFRENMPLSFSVTHHGTPTGPKLSGQDWKNIVDQHELFLSTIAEVVDLLLRDTKSSSGRTQVLNAVLQSLLWLHHACTEENAIASMVGISAALDALSGGKKARGIVAVVNARLGISGETALYEHGPTLNAFVNDMFNQGRSRLVHGTSDKIGHDWSTTWGLAESLARHTLYACITWISENPEVNSIDHLKKSSQISGDSTK